MSEFYAGEFLLDEYLEISLWAAFLQVCFYFGGNEFFPYLALNKESREKSEAIIHNVKISLILFFVALIILVVIASFMSDLYIPLVLVILMMNIRTFIHYVLSSTGSYERDFRTMIIDWLLFMILFIAQDVGLISVWPAIICLVITGILTTSVQAYNFRSSLINVKSDKVSLSVPNSRFSYFYKELMAWLTGNGELFLLLYVLDLESEAFVEYNLLMRISIFLIIPVRLLNKNVTVSVLEVEEDKRFNYLRKAQIYSMILILVLYLFLILAAPFLLHYFSAIEDYEITLFSLIVLSLPVVRSFYTWNIYFNLRGANHLLNIMRSITPIISILLMFLLSKYYDVMGLASASLISGVTSLLMLLFVEKRYFKTVFFE